MTYNREGHALTRKFKESEGSILSIANPKQPDEPPRLAD